MNRRHLVLACASCLAYVGATTHTLAQSTNWPTKPVKLILSQPPGSGADNMARVVSEAVAKGWGQAIVVDNHPGGQNVIGAVQAARAPADGYNFYFATAAALITNKYLFANLPYDPLRDFTPVGMIGRVPFAVLVRSSSPYKSFGDVLKAAQARPGMVSIANEGPKTFGGMIARLLSSRAKADFNLVSYVNVGTAVTDTIGSHTDVLVADLASTTQLVKQGSLRLLAMTTPKRLADWPDVPTLAETMADFDMTGWIAIVAPAGTPPEIIRRFNKDLDMALIRKDVADRIKAMGPIVEGAGTPEQLAAFIKGEDLRWQGLSKEIGILPE